MTGAIGAIYKRLLLAAHPVGCIYQSLDATSPAAIFGGTWEALEEGRTLIQCGSTYPARSRGGEAAHTLTVNEMPVHSHDGITWANSTIVSGNIGSDANLMKLEWNAGNAENAGYSTTYAGGSQSHNNMPPYLAVYMWRRVS